MPLFHCFHFGAAASPAVGLWSLELGQSEDKWFAEGRSRASFLLRGSLCSVLSHRFFSADLLAAEPAIKGAGGACSLRAPAGTAALPARCPPPALRLPSCSSAGRSPWACSPALGPHVRGPRSCTLAPACLAPCPATLPRDAGGPALPASCPGLRRAGCSPASLGVQSPKGFAVPAPFHLPPLS